MTMLEDQQQERIRLIFWCLTLSLSILGLLLSLTVIIKILRFWLIRAAQARKGRDHASRMPQAALEMETLMARLSMFMALIDSGVSAIRIFQTIAFGLGARSRMGDMITRLCYNSGWYQALLHVYFSFVIFNWVSQSSSARNLIEEFSIAVRLILVAATGLALLGIVEKPWAYIVQLVASIICVCLMATFIGQTMMVLLRRGAEEASSISSSNTCSSSNSNSIIASSYSSDGNVTVKKRLRNRLLRAGGASRRLRRRLTSILVFAICAWISAMIAHCVEVFMEPNMTRQIVFGVLTIPLYMIAIVDATILGNAIQTLLRWLHISKPVRVGPSNRERGEDQRASRIYSYKMPPHRPLSRSTHKTNPNFLPSLMPVCEAVESKIGDMDLDDEEDVEDPLDSARARGSDSPTPLGPLAALTTLRHHHLSATVVEE